MDRRSLCKIGLAGIGTMAFSGQVNAMGKYFKTERKKWAIVYGSSCGSTREYAGFINEGLGGIADVVDIATTTPNVADYENFIIGGWKSGNSLQPTNIGTFITGNKAALQSKIKGLFVVLGNNGVVELKAEMTQFLVSSLATPSGVTDKPQKILFGRASQAGNCQPPYRYNNVNRDDGVAFGQNILTTAVAAARAEAAGGFSLHQNSPNPFNPVTTIRYSLPEAGKVTLTVSALNGRTVATLVSGHRAAGVHEVRWDGSDLAPGYYLYQLRAGGLTQTRTARRISR